VSETRLFAPRPAYRFTKQNRALITYALASDAKAPVTIDILDGNTVVRELTGSEHPGINRVAWDLRYAPPRLVELRVPPDVNPHIADEPRFRGKDTRPVTHWGLDPAEVGPIVAPGKYTVRLTVNGKSDTQPLDVLKDPRVPTSDADLEASVKLQLRIRDDVNQASDMINTLEIMRKQIEDMKAGLHAQKKTDLEKAAVEMSKKLFEMETKLLEASQMTSDDKYFQQAYRVYMNLLWLNGEVGPGAGDVAGGADFKPTDTSVQVLDGIEKDLAAAKSEYDRLMQGDVVQFNRMIAEKGIIPLAR
jgi:hypothetical protein